MRVTEEEPTWFWGLRVWWAWFWRYLLIVVILSALVGGGIGAIGALIGLASDTTASIGGGAGFLVGIIFMPFVFKRLMTKGFGKYRLAVVHK
ncbi:MAG: hypothetical protein AAF549_00845 [Pseudomonadota bacterium]